MTKNQIIQKLEDLREIGTQTKKRSKQMLECELCGSIRDLGKMRPSGIIACRQYYEDVTTPLNTLNKNKAKCRKLYPWLLGFIPFIMILLLGTLLNVRPAFFSFSILFIPFAPVVVSIYHERE